MRKRTQARECALQILYQYEINPAPVQEVIKNFWDQTAPSASGKKSSLPAEEICQFAESLVHGTIQHLEEIDRVIEKATENWQLNRMAAIDRNILRFAVYELLFVADIPPKVTINEAVNIAKKFSQEDSGKFVNGVLDKINHTEKARDTSSGSPHGPSEIPT